jgi:hypothetical protein
MVLGYLANMSFVLHSNELIKRQLRFSGCRHNSFFFSFFLYAHIRNTVSWKGRNWRHYTGVLYDVIPYLTGNIERVARSRHLSPHLYCKSPRASFYEKSAFPCPAQGFDGWVMCSLISVIRALLASERTTVAL